MIKISVVTVAYNSEKYIADCLSSVRNQDYPNVEHIVVDGNSADNTLAISYNMLRNGGVIASSPDNGIYDAMNKGVAMATGDVICFLNSDDVFASSNVLSKVAKEFQASNADYIYGDLILCDFKLIPLRRWCLDHKSGYILWGSQLPHPSLFFRTSMLQYANPPYDISYKIAGDLKLQLLITFRLRAKGSYLPISIALMRAGGASTKNIYCQIHGLIEAARAYREVTGTSFGLLFAMIKPILKYRRITAI